MTSQNQACYKVFLFALDGRIKARLFTQQCALCAQGRLVRAPRPRCLQTLAESLVLSWMLRRQHAVLKRQHAVLKRLHLCSFLQSLASGAMKDSWYKCSCYKCKWGVEFLLALIRG